jgi:hypothetical protein
MVFRTAVITGAVLWASAVNADTFRCPNGNIVSTGGSISDVSIKCNPPTSVVRREVPFETTKGKVAYIEVQEWTYNLGPNEFVQYLVFRNGYLSAVRSGDYGR